MFVYPPAQQGCCKNLHSINGKALMIWGQKDGTHIK